MSEYLLFTYLLLNLHFSECLDPELSRKILKWTAGWPVQFLLQWRMIESIYLKNITEIIYFQLIDREKHNENIFRDGVFVS